MKRLNHLLAAAMTIVASPLLANTAEQAVEDAQAAFYDFMDKDITTVRFENGSAVVTDAERRDLRALVESVRDDSKVENIIVAAWSDHEYPEQGKKLSDKDRKLADERAENVKKVLVEVGAKDIDTYSMAEHPSWISKVFNTADAEIKNAIRGQKVEDRTTASIAKTLKAEGGPSTVVVLVKRELSAATSH